jgi:hypothetical protein
VAANANWGGQKNLPGPSLVRFGQLKHCVVVLLVRELTRNLPTLTKIIPRPPREGGTFGNHGRLFRIHLGQAISFRRRVSGSRGVPGGRCVSITPTILDSGDRHSRKRPIIFLQLERDRIWSEESAKAFIVTVLINARTK